MLERRARILTLTCVLALLGGCGGKTIPVKGVVTVDGKPLPYAFVRFVAQDEGGKDASASTDSSGAFQLSTTAPRDGALPGLYKVTVQYSAPVKVAPGKSAAEVQQATVEAAAAEPSLVLPTIYTQIDQTILKHRVPDDGDAKLELKSVAP
jgi:hypothetical protein